MAPVRPPAPAVNEKLLLPEVVVAAVAPKLKPVVGAVAGVPPKLKLEGAEVVEAPNGGAALDVVEAGVWPKLKELLGAAIAPCPCPKLNVLDVVAGVRPKPNVPAPIAGVVPVAFPKLKPVLAVVAGAGALKGAVVPEDTWLNAKLLPPEGVGLAPKENPLPAVVEAVTPCPNADVAG